jgi:hypothetical protein
MKHVIDGLIGLGLLVLGLCSVLLAFYIIAFVFTNKWYVDTENCYRAGFIGFFFGVYLIYVYFNKS